MRPRRPLNSSTIMRLMVENLPSMKHVPWKKDPAAAAAAAAEAAAAADITRVVAAAEAAAVLNAGKLNLSF